MQRLDLDDPAFLFKADSLQETKLFCESDAFKFRPQIRVTRGGWPRIFEELAHCS